MLNRGLMLSVAQLGYDSIHGYIHTGTDTGKMPTNDLFKIHRMINHAARSSHLQVWRQTIIFSTFPNTMEVGGILLHVFSVHKNPIHQISSKKQSVRSNMWTAILSSMSEKDLVCPNTCQSSIPKEKHDVLLHPITFCSMPASMLFLLFWPTVLTERAKTDVSSLKLHSKITLFFIPYFVLWSANL